MPAAPAGPIASRVPALLALALPVLAGLAWMAWQAAPRSYLAVNAGALALGLGWIAFGRLPASKWLRRVLALLLLAVLALPLATGPQISGVARWVPLGPVVLHAGMVALPLLSVLAASDRSYAAPMLLTALLLALLQPDAASAFAVTFACVGLHHVSQDWRLGVAAIVGFLAAIAAALRGELPAQPFVERVLVEVAAIAPAVALALFAALLAAFLLIVFAVPMERSGRYALSGTLFGFAVTAIMSNYPSPLLGYGAAPILGYALALAERRTDTP